MSTTSVAIFSNPLFASYSVYARNASITGYMYRVTKAIVSTCNVHVNNRTGSEVELLRALTKPFTQLVIQVCFLSTSRV